MQEISPMMINAKIKIKDITQDSYIFFVLNSYKAYLINETISRKR